MRRSNPIALAIVLALVVAGCQMFKDDTPRVQAPNSQAALDDAQLARSQESSIQTVGQIEPAALFRGPMPTGVAVSRTGRVFVNFPRWGDPVEFTVAEIKNGQAVPYPDLNMNKLRTEHQTESLISVQSVVIDPKDRLWILDTGSINFGPVEPGGPKLLCVDLNTNRIVKRIPFPDNVALSTSYLNDVRFDLSRGQEGMAFITDSSDKGPNAIIVVDLKSGTSWRKLNDHPSTKADPNFVPTVEGEPLKARPGNGQPEAFIKIGSDGIAIDPKGGLLYYCPLASRRIYCANLDALADGKLSDAETAQTVKELPQRDFASDGLECDGRGVLFLTDYEHNAIRRLMHGGKYEIVAQDPRMIWPDSLAIGPSGWVYFTANQLNRQKNYHEGKDLRQQPYVLFRFRADAQPQQVASR